MRIGIAVSNDRDCATIRQTAESSGHEALACPDLNAALATAVDLAFANWGSGEGLASLLRALQRSKTANPAVPVVVLVPRGAVISGQRAKREGAVDFLFCPVIAREVAAEIQELCEVRPVDAVERERFNELRRTVLIGEHARFLKCLEEVRRAARSPGNVLLLGETGTGKEVFANAIHELSPRRSHRFLAVNCAALPDALLESELFGHARGAYTGAEKPREGRFEAVGAGTLLLDEIGDLDGPLQMKLLRVIEHRRFERLGENDSMSFNGRLVCATSADLNAHSQAGKFRADLMGRINQIRIELPPLRQRRTDIPMLARHFLDRHRGVRLVDLSPSALEVLENFDFPMNIRQLDNAIIHALAQSYPADLILPRHLPVEVLSAANTPIATFSTEYDSRFSYLEAREAVIRDFDRDYLSGILRSCGNNHVAAAKEVGIDRKTLSERLKHVDPTDPTAGE